MNEIKFKKGWMLLREGDGELWLSIRSLVFDCFAIHESVNRYGISNHHYVLTHIPAGARIVTAYKQGNLRKLVAQIAPLGDWNFHSRAVPPALVQKALPIIRAFNSGTSN